MHTLTLNPSIHETYFNKKIWSSIDRLPKYKQENITNGVIVTEKNYKKYTTDMYEEIDSITCLTEGNKDIVKKWFADCITNLRIGYNHIMNVKLKASRKDNQIVFTFRNKIVDDSMPYIVCDDTEFMVPEDADYIRDECKWNLVEYNKIDIDRGGFDNLKLNSYDDMKIYTCKIEVEDLQYKSNDKTYLHELIYTYNDYTEKLCSLSGIDNMSKKYNIKGGSDCE